VNALLIYGFYLCLQVRFRFSLEPSEHGLPLTFERVGSIALPARKRATGLAFSPSSRVFVRTALTQRAVTNGRPGNGRRPRKLSLSNPQDFTSSSSSGTFAPKIALTRCAGRSATPCACLRLRAQTPHKKESAVSGRPFFLKLVQGCSCQATSTAPFLMHKPPQAQASSLESTVIDFIVAILASAKHTLHRPG
jgi:hypothetical protein